MRITSSPCSPQNHGAPQLVLNRERGAGPCVFVCVCVCVSDREREMAREKEIHKVVSEGGYGVYKRLNTELIVDPGALHVHLSSKLRCVCVHACAGLCECLLTTSPVSVGPLQRLGRATVTDAPDCQLVSFVKTTS